MFKEFKAFISRGNVVDLAVGIVVGTAFTAIVTSLVNDVIMPPIGWLLGGIDFSDYFIALSTHHYDSLAAAKQAGAATINYGLFVNTIIRFLVVSFAVFLLIRQVHRLYRAEAAAPAKPSRQEELLGEIRDLLAAGRGGAGQGGAGQAGAQPEPAPRS